MVICPMCLESTAGALGDEITCSRCATRFIAGKAMAPPLPRGQGPKRPAPPVAPWRKACALAPYLTPFAALGIYVGGYGDTSRSSPLANVLAIAVYALGIGAGIAAIGLSGRVQSRWVTVAGFGLGFAFIGFPLLLTGAFLFVLTHSGLPGG